MLKLQFLYICFFFTARETSFTERHRVSVPRTSSFQLYEAEHYGWFVCVGDRLTKLRYKMEFLYDDESESFKRNCSFFIMPASNCTSKPKFYRNSSIIPPSTYIYFYALVIKETANGIFLDEIFPRKLTLLGLYSIRANIARIRKAVLGPAHLSWAGLLYRASTAIARSSSYCICI